MTGITGISGGRVCFSLACNGKVYGAVNYNPLPCLSPGTAFFWNVEALMTFLTRNGLSHVIRAHEVQQSGFQVRNNNIM